MLRWWRRNRCRRLPHRFNKTVAILARQRHSRTLRRRHRHWRGCRGQTPRIGGLLGRLREGLRRRKRLGLRIGRCCKGSGCLNGNILDQHADDVVTDLKPLIMRQMQWRGHPHRLAVNKGSICRDIVQPELAITEHHFEMAAGNMAVRIGQSPIHRGITPHLEPARVGGKLQRPAVGQVVVILDPQGQFHFRARPADCLSAPT